MVTHKHNWESVLDTVVSTDPTHLMHIYRCQECQAVKVHYKDINKTRIINKPKR